MRIEGYRDLELLASGTTSDTYRGRLPATDRWLAVKVFRFALGEEQAVRRYLKALDQAQELSSHPRLATIYDAGLTADRQPYITMQLVPGGSTADRLALASHGPFPPADGLRLAIQACEALEVAHDAGLVHRFVQPTSLLLPAADRVVLSEVGVPLFVERWEASGYLDSSVPYHTAPEILERETAGPAADVYSLASTLHTLLTGRPPRQDPSVVSVPSLLFHALRQEPPVLAGPGIPEGLSAVLAAALAPDPDQRTGQARTFREALEALLDEVDEAGPEPAPDGLSPPTVGGDQDDPTDPDPDPAGPPVPTPLPKPVPGTALEPVDDGAATSPSRRYRTAGLALAGGVAIAMGIFIGRIGPAADDPDSRNSGGNPAGETSAGEQAPDGTGTSTPQPPEDGRPDDAASVPTGLEVTDGDAGILVRWDETDTQRFVVLVLSETAPPQLEAASGTSHLLTLDADNGYCIAVARQDTIGAGADRDGDGPSDLGRWFTPLRCTGGASADTVLFNP